MTSDLKVYRDEVTEKLDELADLGEYWKKHREQGRTPSGVKAGMVAVIEEIKFILQRDQMNTDLKRTPSGQAILGQD